MTGNFRPILLSIHVEPDDRLIEHADQDWAGFLDLAQYLRSNRARLEDVSGNPVRFTWCLRLDPQIADAFGSADWVLRRHRTLLDQLLADGDEMGLHVHSWRPARRWFKRTWRADYADHDWVEQCVRMAYDAFVAHFGCRPAAISMGDHYMSNQTMKLIDDLGVRVDYSMVPGMAPLRKLRKCELSRGVLPDYRGVPDRPFKPSVADFSRPGVDHHQVWEIPLSAGEVRHPITGAHMQTGLLLGTMPDWVEGIVAQNLARSAPYLHAEARSEVRTVADNRERFDWALDYLARLGRERNLRFSTLSEFCDSLDKGEPSLAA